MYHGLMGAIFISAAMISMYDKLTARIMHLVLTYYKYEWSHRFLCAMPTCSLLSSKMMQDKNKNAFGP